MLKWIIIYNSSFSNNHKELFNELEELAKKGTLELWKQCDWVKIPGNIEKLLKFGDKKELLTNKTYKELTPDTDIASLIAKNPKKTLCSVISLWYYDLWEEFTRIDCGQVELKYLLDSERRMPKWTKLEEFW